MISFRKERRQRHSSSQASQPSAGGTAQQAPNTNLRNIKMPTAPEKPLKQKAESDFQDRLRAGLSATRYSVKRFPILSLCNLGLALTRSVVPLVGISYVGRIIDELGRSNQLTSEVLWNGGMMIGFIAITSVLGSLSARVASAVGERIFLATDERFLQAIGDRDLTTLNSSADKKASLKAKKFLWKFRTVQNDLIGMLSSGVEVAAAAYLIGRHDLLSLGLITAFMLPRVITSNYFISKSHELTDQQIEEENKYWNRRSALLDSEVATTVKIMGRFAVIARDVVSHGKKWIGLKEDLEWRSYRWGLVVELVGCAALGFAIFNSINLVTQGAITVGGLSIVLGAAQRFYGSIGAFFGQATNTYGNLKYISDTERYLAAKSPCPEATQVISSSGAPKLDWKNGVTITLKNLSFAYPSEDGEGQGRASIFNRVNLEIKPGMLVGIVGENGAGKSTLASLLLRVRQPTEGEILFNNVPVSEIPTKEFYDHIAAQLQDSRVIWSFSIGETILLGRPLQREGLTIEEAAKASGTQDFIDCGDIKHGFDTVIGEQFSNGQGLSGGQLQSIKSARAIVRDAPVLILDEPGASLDAIREKNLIHGLILNRHSAERRGRYTTFVISHDFNVLKDADVVVVIGKEGTGIIEVGSHEELLKKGGAYHRLYTTKVQAAVEGILPLLPDDVAMHLRALLLQKNDIKGLPPKN